MLACSPAAAHDKMLRNRNQHVKAWVGDWAPLGSIEADVASVDGSGVG